MIKILCCITYLIIGVAHADTCDVPEPFRLLNNKEMQPFQQVKPQQSGNTQPELINFWATWCAPCRKELPFLQTLNEEKHANVTLINIEDKPADAEKILSQLNIDKLTTKYAAMELLDNLAIQGLPSSVLYHKNDIYLGVGVLKDEQSINAWLHCLQNPKSE